MTQKLKLVTINNFYKNQEHPMAQKTFSEMLLLRKEGYGPEYPDNFLPYDLVDFIAIQHIFCVEKNNGSIEVIGGLRNVSMQKASYYNLQLPLYKAVQESHSKLHIQTLEHLIQSHKESNEDLMYSSSLVIAKKYRQDKDLCRQIKNLSAAMTCYDAKAYNFKTTICGAVLRFKTDRLFTTWGYKHMSDTTNVLLPPFPKMSAGGEKVLLMYFNEPSDFSKECLKNFEHTMKERIVFNDPISTELPSQKAA